MPEEVSAQRDEAALIDCRARVADTRAHVALLDSVVSAGDHPPPYAPGIRTALTHLQAALTHLDEARLVLASSTDITDITE